MSKPKNGGEPLYKVWARIEIYDPAEDEHEDLDDELCEYKVYETTDRADLAEWLGKYAPDGEQNIYGEIKSAMKQEGIEP